MNDTKRYKADILLSIFARKGGTGQHTFPFESLDPVSADHIRRTVVFEPEEQPVLIVYFSESTWTLITTLRLFRCHADQILYIRLSDIRFVKPEAFGKTQKRCMNTLCIETSGSAAGCSIELEAGAPFIGIWNVLAFVWRKNHSLNNLENFLENRLTNRKQDGPWLHMERNF